MRHIFKRSSLSTSLTVVLSLIYFTFTIVTNASPISPFCDMSLLSVEEISTASPQPPPATADQSPIHPRSPTRRNPSGTSSSSSSAKSYTPLPPAKPDITGSFSLDGMPFFRHCLAPIGQQVGKYGPQACYEDNECNPGCRCAGTEDEAHLDGYVSNGEGGVYPTRLKIVYGYNYGDGMGICGGWQRGFRVGTGASRTVGTGLGGNGLAGGILDELRGGGRGGRVVEGGL
ncbi:MAG: hypothetical protein M1827_004839 [Pycnora praestabilis]|nr:MAG: hypothetical protein M1827_004839 [Pycnora praestabilis]